MNEELIFNCKNLSKTYFDSVGRKVQALKNVSLEIKKGETFGLIGESGSGKTTLGYTMLNLLNSYSGKIYFYGKDISEFNHCQKKEFRRKCQIIFQDPYSSIDGNMSISALIREGLDIHHIGSSKNERNQIVEEIMESVGLDSSMKNRKPETLSGGQRQRIAIAQALVLHPEFIVCDEIVSSLDVLIQAQVLNLLKDLQNKYFLTYFFISHDLNVVSYMADRIAVMYKGEIVESGTTEKLMKNPEHPYTKALFSYAGLSDRKL